VVPRFHMGITIWERGLSSPHFHTETVRFHTGIQNKWITITIRGSRYGNGDQHIPIWKWLITVSIWGLRICGSPFPYRDPRMETGIDASPFPYGYCPLPYGDLTQMDPCFHIGITGWKRGLRASYYHMGTIQSLTHYHKVFVTIWEFRKKSTYENN
jgi:hypothetical protein